MFRRAQAKGKMKDYLEAIEDYKACISMDASMEKSCTKEIQR